MNHAKLRARPASALQSAPTLLRPSEPPPSTVASALVEILLDLGVKQAYGVSGGAMASVWDALSTSRLNVIHCRHEAGAAFAATEAHFASNRPSAVFTTAGPGLTNALTGVIAAREEGAQLIVISAHSSDQQRGRFAIQETSAATLPPALYRSGRPFHFAAVVNRPEQLAEVRAALREGLDRPGGFVAHLAVDTSAQRQRAQLSAESPSAGERAPVDPADVLRCVEALQRGGIAFWVGFGARGAAAEIRELARRFRVPVICSPRGKGIFPEDDELFVGVTGLGGHTSVLRYFTEAPPRQVMVLGSRLGEATSFWDGRFIPEDGFLHVDVDQTAVGAAYPSARSVPIVADVRALLRSVLAALPRETAAQRADDLGRDGSTPTLPRPDVGATTPRPSHRVRPELLLDLIQRHVVEGSRAIVLGESGNSFLWTTHRLRFSEPGRYRVSTSVGAMGHAAAGVLGAALGGGRRAVALVGDGAFLMNNEINTAVKYAAPVVWFVLNDARYGMCAQGMQTLGLTADAEFPEVDFAAFARAQGARALRVRSELELELAVIQAMNADGPFVVDVLIDRSCRAPADLRNGTLAATQASPRDSFPITHSSID